MNKKNIFLKGALIFGVIGFAVFLVLIIAGMVMNALGFTCDCFAVFSWSLIGVALATFALLWFGCCCRDKDEEKCIKTKKEK